MIKLILSKIKHHKILTLALGAYGCLAVYKPASLGPALWATGTYLVEMLQVLPAVFILTALLQTWIPQKTIVSLFGASSGLKGYGLAFALGSLSAGPIYAAFPVCQTLLNKGAHRKNIVIILSAWAVVKLPMLINEAKFMGFAYMNLRWVVTSLAIIAMAHIFCLIVKKEDVTTPSQSYGINPKICMMCKQCLKAYPQVFGVSHGKVVIIDNKLFGDVLRSICPVGAIDMPD